LFKIGFDFVRVDPLDAIRGIVNPTWRLRKQTIPHRVSWTMIGDLIGRLPEAFGDSMLQSIDDVAATFQT